MKVIFKRGDKKEFRKLITSHDVAVFNGEVVHSVYATFSLARDAEWTTRQFVLEMRSDDEEGIGTFLTIEHKGPAFVGEEIIFTAWVERIEGNELICCYEAKVSDRLVATGKTGQKIFTREKLHKILSKNR